MAHKPHRPASTELAADATHLHLRASAYSLNQRAFVAHSEEVVVWYDYDRLKKCTPEQGLLDAVWASMHLARCVASHVGSSHKVSQSKGDAGVGHVRGGCQLAPRRARAPQAPARSELGEMRTRRQPPKTRRRSRRGKPKVGDLAARIEKASGSRDSPRRCRSHCDAQTKIRWCRLSSGLPMCVAWPLVARRRARATENVHG